MEKILDIQLSDNSKVKLHTHDFLELVYVLQGGALHVINDRKIPIKKGDYFIIDYNAFHGYIPDNNNGFLIVNCLFKPQLIDRTLKYCRSFADVILSYMLSSGETEVISPANYVFNDDGSILPLIDNMRNEFDKKMAGYAEIIRSNLIEIIIKTRRKVSGGEKDGQSLLSGKIRKFADSNYMDKNILTKLSDKYNYSVSHLSKTFRQETGIGFNTYLKKVRVSASCALLANTDKKIIDIAELSGYLDTEYFSRVFKQIIGMSPFKYRKLHAARKTDE